MKINDNILDTAFIQDAEQLKKGIDAIGTILNDSNAETLFNVLNEQK